MATSQGFPTARMDSASAPQEVTNPGSDQPCCHEGSGVLASWTELTSPRSFKPQYLWRFVRTAWGRSAEGISEWPEQRVHGGVGEMEMDGKGGKATNGLANRSKALSLRSETRRKQINESQ